MDLVLNNLQRLICHKIQPTIYAFDSYRKEMMNLWFGNKMQYLKLRIEWSLCVARHTFPNLFLFIIFQERLILFSLFFIVFFPRISTTHF